MIWISTQTVATNAILLHENETPPLLSQEKQHVQESDILGVDLVLGKDVILVYTITNAIQYFYDTIIINYTYYTRHELVTITKIFPDFPR